MVEEREFARAPALATVRRHWPNERDRVGHVIRGRHGWAFAYAKDDCPDEQLLCPSIDRLRPGHCLTITEPDGRRLSYRVM